MQIVGLYNVKYYFFKSEYNKLKWTYRLSVNDYRVAMFAKLYLALTGIIMKNLKSKRRSFHPYINDQSYLLSVTDERSDPNYRKASLSKL